MNIAYRIQNLRKTKGLSQEELAEKIGVSRQAVSKWESDQSMPDLDKIIIISEYFDVTTDFILKGVENPPKAVESNKNNITSQILYIASTAFLAIGLLTAFGGWYAEQSNESIWGSMIIQIVGLVGYYIGNLLSKSKAPFMIKWLNTIITLFMPVSLLVTIIFNRILSPYPVGIKSSFTFVVIYASVVTVSFFMIKKRNKDKSL